MFPAAASGSAKYSDTQMIDAMCLIETIHWNSNCMRAYDDRWENGIYEFRDAILIVAQFTHSAWEYITHDENGEEDEFMCFDSEYCPSLIEYLLIQNLVYLVNHDPDGLRYAVQQHALKTRYELALKRRKRELE